MHVGERRRELFTRARFLIGLLIRRSHKQGDLTNRPSQCTHLLTAIVSGLEIKVRPVAFLLPPTTPKKSRNMSLFFLVGIFFLRHSEEVSVDLFTSTVWGLAEKGEDVISLGEVSGIDPQRGERQLFAEPDFVGPAPDDFPTLNGLDDYLIARVKVVIQFHQQTRFSG